MKRAFWVLSILAIGPACATPNTAREMPIPTGPVNLADGGLAIGFEDGREPAPVSAVDSECGADAGAFLRLLSRRDCLSDADCRVYRPGLAVDDLDVCYPVRADLVTSGEFDNEYRNLARACGRATMFSTHSCSRSLCVNQLCELAK